MKDLLLITPPFTQLNTPYPATAYLKGFLNTKNISAYQMDLGIEVILEMFSKEGLTDIFNVVTSSEVEMHEKEKELIKQVQLFPEVIQNAAANHSPALIANYTYDLVKEFNSFYQQVSILGEENHDKKVFRVQLSKSVGNTIKNAFQLLGIEVPERM